MSIKDVLFSAEIILANESCTDNITTHTELSLMEEKKKRLASRARLQYHEKKLKSFQDHLKQGTYPKQLRLSPYPKMKTEKGQALIKKACDKVKQMILLEMTNEAQEELTQEQKVYKSLQEKKPKTTEQKQALKIKTLQKELTCLRTQLSEWMKEKESLKVNPGEPDVLSAPVSNPQRTDEEQISEKSAIDCESL